MAQWVRAHGGLVIVALSLLLLVSVLYAEALSDPGAVVFSTSGDGAKNYFTFAYHVQYGDAYWNDKGFNFPYGESVVYADAQPWLAWLLGALPLTGVQAIGVLNILLVIGVVLHGIFLHRILGSFGVKGWAAVLAALGAALMTPQVFRIPGHMGLAHAWLLSLGWWLSVRAKDRTGWKPQLAVGTVMVFAYFTHPYLGLMLAMLLGTHTLLTNITEGHWWRWRPLALQVVAPTLLFFGALRIFDVHVDRPAVPNTYLDNAQSIAGLCDPIQRTFLKPITDIWDSGTEAAWESWCYLGAGTIVLAALIVVVHLLRGFGWKREGARGLDVPALWLVASLVPLFFALDLQSALYDLLPALKQFRSLSRFAWVFQMVLVVFVLVRSHDYIRTSRGFIRYAAGAMFILACGADIVEGFTQQQSVAEWSTGHPDPFERDNLDPSTEAMVKVAEAFKPVAVMPLPFGHGGAEVYNRGGDERANGALYPIAYHSGAAVLAGITSRTALEEARRQFGLLAPLEFTKAIKADLQMGDTVLVICAPDGLDADEQRLMDRCHPILENSTGRLLWITTDELVECTAALYMGWYEQVIEPFSVHTDAPWGLAPEKAPRLLTRWQDGVMEWPEGTTIADTAGAVFVPLSPREFEAEVRDTKLLYEFAPGSLDPAAEYELGFVFREIDKASRNIPVIWEHNTPGRSDGTWEKLWDMRRLPMQMPDRTICTVRFSPKAGKRNALLLSGRAWVDLQYSVDHIYLRRVDVHYWRTEKAPGGELIVRDNIPLNPEVLNVAGARGN